MVDHREEAVACGAMVSPSWPEAGIAAVVLHPHPAMGGDRDHPLIVAIAEGLADRGFAALRPDLSDPDPAASARALEATAAELMDETRCRTTRTGRLLLGLGGDITCGRRWSRCPRADCAARGDVPAAGWRAPPHVGSRTGARPVRRPRSSNRRDGHTAGDDNRDHRRRRPLSGRSGRQHRGARRGVARTRLTPAPGVCGNVLRS